MHRTIVTLTLMLLPAAWATGQGTVLLDQIGAPDGSDINTFAVLQNQIDPDDVTWNTAVLEPFQNPDGLPLARIDSVIGGNSGYQGVDSITGMRVLVFSSVEAAVSGDLAGDVLDVYVAGPPEADADWNWAGTRDLISVQSWAKSDIPH